MIVSEHDTERVAWSNSDSGGAIARKSGTKDNNSPYPSPRPTLINIRAGNADRVSDLIVLFMCRGVPRGMKNS